MSEIIFSKEEKEIIVERIKMYFREELDQEIGRFDAEFLIDFFTNELGSYFYNRGLYDAQAIISQKVEDLSESVYDLEKPTEFSK